MLSSLARTAVTMNHKLGSLDNRNVLSPSSGSQKSEIMVSSGLVPSEGCEGSLSHASSLASRGLVAIFGVPWLV